MKILMLKTENGSIDGIRVTVYAAGAEYDLSETPGSRDLAAAFVAAGMARATQVEQPPARAVVEPVEVTDPPVVIEPVPEVVAVAAPAATKHRKQK